METYLDHQTLWPGVLAVTESALASNVLETIPTRCISLKEGSLDFEIRVVGNLERKSQQVKSRAAQSSDDDEFDPFLPYDKSLYVGELTEHYRCILNKFNVLDHHLLLVTREFREQSEPLSVIDFLAASVCLQAHSGLVFYNGGRNAGASVRHKHLQMIPELGLTGKPFPFAIHFEQEVFRGENDYPIKRSPALPFPHGIVRSAFSDAVADLEWVAYDNYHLYLNILRALSLTPRRDGLMPALNVLMTREYLWVVPRSREKYKGISVNALGFAGALLVNNEAQLLQLQQTGIKETLSQVAQAQPPSG